MLFNDVTIRDCSMSTRACLEEYIRWVNNGPRASLTEALTQVVCLAQDADYGHVKVRGLPLEVIDLRRRGGGS